VLAQLLHREQPAVQAGPEDLRVHRVGGVQLVGVQAVQLVPAVGEGGPGLGQAGLGQVGQPVVVAVIAQVGGLLRLQPQQVLDDLLGQHPEPLDALAHPATLSRAATGHPPGSPSRAGCIAAAQRRHSGHTGTGRRFLGMTTTSPTPTGTDARPALRRPDGTPIRALVVDDEPALTDLLSMALRYEGWDVRTAADGSTAVTAARQFRPDVVLLDVMLPDLDGLAVLRRIRADDQDVPVVFLTARDAVDDRIAGLTVGADDYVTKPFSLEEVVARLRALLRRSGATAVRSSGELVVGDLVLDEDGREVTRAGVPVSLTATEFELLRFLMRNPKRVLSKAQILDRVWSYDFGGQANVVELYVSYLRKKIDAGREPMIHTVRGVGYVLRPAG
jgi:two-component system OmpR family response regulator